MQHKQESFLFSTQSSALVTQSFFFLSYRGAALKLPSLKLPATFITIA